MWTDIVFSPARWPWILLAALALGTLACGPHFQNRAPDCEILPSRTVVLPPIVSADIVDLGDNVQDDPKHAKTIVDVFLPEMERQRSLLRMNPFAREKLDQCGEPCLDQLQSLMEWGADASLEIMAQMRGRKDFKRDSVVDWRAQRSYERLRKVMGADFALIVRAHDTRPTKGRLLIPPLAGVITSYLKFVSVCVADLLYGRMVWCEAKVGGSRLMEDPEGVQSAFTEILSGFESAPRSSSSK
jgi:hypothetical protein